MADMSDIILRRVNPGELDWINNIAPDVFDETPSRKFLESFLAEPGHWLVLAMQGSEVVGKCSAMAHRRPDKPAELYIDEIDVTPALRQRGIAKQILAKMLTIADEWGCEECWVGTEPDNVPARKLYESNGAKAEKFVLYYMEY